MINIVNHTIFLDEEKFNSYNRHYVKWRLDWWKTPVFETSNRSSFVQLVIVISI